MSRRSVVRLWWAAVGLLLVGLGGVGLVVPGLPATGFFVAAAWCFARSNERLERWLLGLPVVGQLVGDYRDGLGMARQAKAVAIGTMLVAVTASVVITRDRVPLAITIAAACAIGSAVVLWWVPTKERVLAVRAAASVSAAPTDRHR